MVHVEYLQARNTSVGWQPETDLVDIIEFEPGDKHVLTLADDSVVVIEGSAEQIRALANRILAALDKATP